MSPGGNPPSLVLLLPRAQIQETVQRLAREMDRDYKGRRPLLVGVLKGSFIFLSDLVRLLETPVRVEFISMSTYGPGTVTSGRPRVAHGVARDVIEGRDVVLVEDIVDTGITTQACLRYLQRFRPSSLGLCALLDKPGRRRVPVAINYRGIQVPNRFLVGYGLDLDQQFRHFPDIYAVNED